MSFNQKSRRLKQLVVITGPIGFSFWIIWSKRLEQLIVIVRAKKVKTIHLKCQLSKIQKYVHMGFCFVALIVSIITAQKDSEIGVRSKGKMV
jgi:hypothetical protein